MSKFDYAAFFWWLEGYLSVTDDVEPIKEKMKLLTDNELEETSSWEDRSFCVCGYNCGGDDCRY